MEERKKRTEGKTKIIWESSFADAVIIESKDDITAGDGAKRDIIENKGALSTTTTYNCFGLLTKKGVPNHFLHMRDEKTFTAVKLQMIPVELVARRIAFGSYLKRHPGVKEGFRFQRLRREMFLKDDKRHDPLMIWDEDGLDPGSHTPFGAFFLYDAKKPLKEGFIGLLPRSDFLLVPDNYTEVKKLLKILSKTFCVLEEAWREQNVTLVDLKIECGYAPDGTIMVGDVIDNDSWRIWPGGDKSQMKDKQIYRDAPDVAKVMTDLKNNYQWVAEATSHF
ncbi:MAG: phosphoribosylaminoimidazolesuccinocarboxamide synthase [Patescibacteria group bacterium]